MKNINTYHKKKNSFGKVKKKLKKSDDVTCFPLKVIDSRRLDFENIKS